MFEEKSSPLLCRQLSEEPIGYGFGHCCNMKKHRNLFRWRAKRWRSSLWISLPRRDGETIIDFACDFPLSALLFDFNDQLLSSVCYKYFVVCGFRGKREFNFDGGIMC
jgi:hypothetical protein